jgi:hypothetical protein
MKRSHVAEQPAQLDVLSRHGPCGTRAAPLRPRVSRTCDGPLTLRAIAALLPLVVLSSGCVDAPFPIEAASSASQFTVNAVAPQDSTTRTVVEGIVRGYAAWPVIEECRTSTCDQVELAWGSEGTPVANVALCYGCTVAKADGQAGGVCGRRIPEPEVRRLRDVLSVCRTQ